MLHYAALDAFCTRQIYVALVSLQQRLHAGTARYMPPRPVPFSAVRAKLQELLKQGAIPPQDTASAHLGQEDTSTLHSQRQSSVLAETPLPQAGGSLDDATKPEHRHRQRRRGGRKHRAKPAAEKHNATHLVNENDTADEAAQGASWAAQVQHRTPNAAAQHKPVHAQARAVQQAPSTAPVSLTSCATHHSSGAATWRSSGHSGARGHRDSSYGRSPLVDNPMAADASQQHAPGVQRRLQFEGDGQSNPQDGHAMLRAGQAGDSMAKASTEPPWPVQARNEAHTQLGECAAQDAFSNQHDASRSSGRDRSCVRGGYAHNSQASPPVQLQESTVEFVTPASQASVPRRGHRGRRQRGRGGGARGPPAVVQLQTSTVRYIDASSQPDMRSRPTALYVEAERRAAQAAGSKGGAPPQAALADLQGAKGLPLAPPPAGSVWDPVEWYFHSVEQLPEAQAGRPAAQDLDRRPGSAGAGDEASWVVSWGIAEFKKSAAYAELLRHFAL